MAIDVVEDSEYFLIKSDLTPSDRAKDSKKTVFRGISRNGKKWQTMVMYNSLKYFSVSLPSEEMAARVYDRCAIQNHGLRAKTNFSYTRQEISLMKLDI